VTARPDPGHEPHHRLPAGALLTAGVAVVLTAGYLRLLRDHAALPAVARYAMEVALPQWKLSEPVNEVVYGRSTTTPDTPSAGSSLWSRRSWCDARCSRLGVVSGTRPS
jgi:hypothetical protein